MDRQKAFSHRHSTDMSRHWCPQSQRYAGGDALLTHLHNGWQIKDEVYYEQYWQGGARRVVIYYFALANNGQRVTMPVVNNPFVERLMREMALTVLPASANRAGGRQPRGMMRQLH